MTRAVAEKAQEEPKDCKQSTDVLADLSDTFLNNYDNYMQESSETVITANTLIAWNGNIGYHLKPRHRCG